MPFQVKIIKFKNKIFHISDITLVDKIAQRLMQKLHDELDYDDDGNVSLDEGAEVQA